ncbi:TRPT1 [Mytilus coruscus]|uniref:TRPT1 n=1 Tax=Mytilus coruscus TaxID=42192 RepID=A0A6J8CEA0_MYTCO|nr:TRPT1 [Mytilus coruscus]
MFSPNGGGQNIGPPPEDQGRHDEMLNRVNTVVDGGHIAPQGTPSRVHGQSAFKQEAWHQGQSPGHWGGPSQMDSAYLDYSPYHGDARARPKTPGNWDGGYREQLQKKEWRHHIIGDPKQGSPPHQRSSIGNKLYRPDEDSALDKNVQTRGGTPSHPRGHASNYASQGSAPCTQPAHTGWGSMRHLCSRYGKWQDNQGEDTRQVPAHTYGERQDNRGEDTRQTPARAYWGRQSHSQYNQGYTLVPPHGVTAEGSYGQHAYPVPYNEDRPRENTRGPYSKVKQNCNRTIKLKRDYSGGRSEFPQMKLGLSVVESVSQGRVAEVAIVGSGVGARDKDGNREPSVSVKVKERLSRLDCYLLKCLANILRHGALELDHSFLPGGYLLVEEILKSHPGFAGYSLPDIQKLIKVDVDRMFTLIKDTDSGSWKIRANQGYSLMVDTPTIPLVEKCEVPQGNLVAPALLTGDQEGPVANIMREPIGAILPIENSSSIHKVAAPTETTLACDEEAQESCDSTSDGEADTTLEEGSSDEKMVIVCPQYQDSTCPTPVVDTGMTDNTEKSRTSLTFVDPSSTGEIDRKAAPESNSLLNKETVITFNSSVIQESVYINPESPDLGLGLLFKADNVVTRCFKLQRPPVDSGTTALRVTIASVRCGPNRRQWDPGIPYLYKGINTVQVKKNETKLFTTENGSAQPPGSNKIEDLQPLSVQGLVCIKTGKSWHTIQRRTIHSCLGSQFVGNPLY